MIKLKQTQIIQLGNWMNDNKDVVRHTTIKSLSDIVTKAVGFDVSTSTIGRMRRDLGIVRASAPNVRTKKEENAESLDRLYRLERLEIRVAFIEAHIPDVLLTQVKGHWMDKRETKAYPAKDTDKRLSRKAEGATDQLNPSQTVKHGW